MPTHGQKKRVARALCAVLIAALPALDVAADEPGAPLNGSALVELLETGQISLGSNDALLRVPASGLQHQTTGAYSVFTLGGLDTTDSISLISKDGAFIYANYGSCSESKTYFRSRAKYLRYLLAAR